MSNTANQLVAVGSPKTARVNEGISWTLDTTKWGTSPTPGTVTATNRVTDADVTSDVLSGSPSVTGNVITLPKFSSSTVGQFRIIVEFTAGAYAPARPAIDVDVIE